MSSVVRGMANPSMTGTRHAAIASPAFAPVKLIREACVRSLESAVPRLFRSSKATSMITKSSMKAANFSAAAASPNPSQVRKMPVENVGTEK